MTVLQLLLTVFMTVYTFSLLMVSLYGVHRYVLVALYYRYRHRVPTPAGEFKTLPKVTIQLPMYNEQFVARRIIEQTCKIEYPRESLQIQVLDDSTDQTTQIARQAVDEAKALGYDIEYIHRDDRSGFKAGALQNGLLTATGEFIAIFDADFVPRKDFLIKSMPYFTDPKVCTVQSRWEHLNRQDSLLTRSQAILLDGHFAIEHVARNRSDRFMSFNGTAGTWRLAAIDSAGGWQHDTLTEDLDLSYRAQLKGWKFVFLPDLTAPAELPPEMNAFKAQQFRWTKGGAQTAIKLLPRVLLSKAPLHAKVESFFHLTSFTMHLYMLVLVGLMGPAMYLRTVPVDGGAWRMVFDASVFALGTLSASVFYMASQFELRHDWRAALKYMPVMMALAIGLCLSNGKAVVEAIIGRRSDFVRTPKYGSMTAAQLVAGPVQKRAKRNILPYLELAFGVYMACCLVLSLLNSRSAVLTPFLAMFTFGFFYVGVGSLLSQRAKVSAAQPAEVVVKD